MEQIMDYLNLEVSDAVLTWITFAVATVLLAVAGAITHRIVMAQLHRLAKKAGAYWDDDLVDNIGRPTFMMLLSIILYFSTEISRAPFRDHAIYESGLKAAFIVFLFWTVERIVYSLIKGNILLSSLNVSTKMMVSTILRAGVLVIAILMVLDSAGISITPLLASLGVGSVAVALALQDTLSNFFSGLYILADKPFRIGDYIEIEGGIQGYVSKVGWRSTHVRMMSNNIVVVPNSKMASTIMTNYDLLDNETSLLIPVGVSYSSDLEKVERVTIDLAKKVIESVEGGVCGFEPFIRYVNFGDSSINFNVILRVQKYDIHFLVRHEFIKALHKAYNEAGIEIPFPQRVVHMTSN